MFYSRERENNARAAKCCNLLAIQVIKEFMLQSTLI